MTDNNGQVVLVTAASQGIGEALARGLASRGFRVGVMARSEATLSLAESIGGIGVQGSVTSTEDLSRFVHHAVEKYGCIDGVVNNTGRDKESLHVSGAGYDPDLDRDLNEITDDSWLAGAELYFLNVVRMARILTPIFQKQGKGSIVNISSFAALEPRLIYPVSSAMRLALAAYTKMYADRYAREGIRMNNILPGFVENWPMEETVRRTIPLGRAVAMEELVGSAAFLLSADSGSITGQNLLIDGGVNRGI